MNGAPLEPATFDDRAACLLAETSPTRCEPGVWHRHHVIPQQVLRRHGHGDLVYRRENMVILCSRHHQRHHSGHEALPRDLLPVEVFEFAAEIDLEWWLDRHYPAASDEGGRAA